VRLEGLAAPGSICVSGTVRDHVGDRLPYAFEDLGEQSVKNIARPVRIYAVRPGGTAGLPTASGSSTTSSSPPFATPRLSIVVLPFTNLSDDREQQYFADGITEDLTTDLSRLENMFVMIDLPENLAQVIEEITLDTVELPPGEKALLSLQLPSKLVVVLDPVTHMTQFLEVKGEPTRERQSLSLLFDKVRSATETMELRPGPLRLSLENRTDTRVLPGLWVATEGLNKLLSRRKPFLTAKRLLTNQVFRDLYGADTIDVDQRLKITSLTFLFTDLRGSTELYERVGDLVAFDLVRAHFEVLNDIIAAEAGAVVKTSGDAVMATFSTPDRAVAAALRMREAMRDFKDAGTGDGLLLKIGIHEGPCLAVVLDKRQDYFGRTVNIAARVQDLADSRSTIPDLASCSKPAGSSRSRISVHCAASPRKWPSTRFPDCGGQLSS
jgi:class 3 adenylate cyclase